MTTTMKIALSPMTVFDSSLTIPEMIETHASLSSEGFRSINHHLEICKRFVNNRVIHYVINRVFKDDGRIMLDLSEYYDDTYNEHYDRKMTITEALNWIFD